MIDLPIELRRGFVRVMTDGCHVARWRPAARVC